MRTPLSHLRERILDHFLQSLGVRRQRIIAWRSMERTGVRDLRFERDGLIWNTRVFPSDEIGRQIFADGGFQLAEMQAVLGWARRFGIFSGPRNVLIDAGANIGTTCIPMVRAAGCRALAIEPVSENFAWLRQNVELNGLTGEILLAQKAITVQPGRLRMCLTASPGCHFADNHIADSGGSGSADPANPLDVVDDYEEVEADTLVGIIAAAGLKADEIALVWADVQGCELAVIESGRDLWARGVPLWAEVEPHSLRWQGTLGIFAESAAKHFDRFIASCDLMRQGAGAVPQPIARFGELIAAITPEQRSTDVLLLPPGLGANRQT